MPPTDAERALIRAAQYEWDARCKDKRLFLQAQDAGLSVSAAHRVAALQTRDELGPRPDDGKDVLGNILAAVVPLLTLAGLGVTLGGPAVAALKSPAGRAALETIRKGLQAAGVDSPAEAVDTVAGMIGDAMKYSFLTGLKKVGIQLGIFVATAAAVALGSNEAKAIVEQIPVVGGLIFLGISGGVALAINWLKVQAKA